MEEQKEEKNEQGKGGSMIKKLILGVIVLLILAGGGLYGAVAAGLIDPDNFNLEDLKLENWGKLAKSEFAAKVNGEGIDKKIFDVRYVQTKANYEAQGGELGEAETAQIRQEVLDDMVNEELLIQYGEKQGIEAQESEIEARYQEIVGQFESEDQFKSQLNAQGVTFDDVRVAISQELTINKVEEQQAAEQNIAISEEEMHKTYDEAVAAGQEVPPFDEVKGEIEEFLRQQKIDELVADLIEQLRSEADIEIL